MYGCRFLLLLFFVAGCQKTAQDPCSYFEGIAMTIPYHIVIGKNVSREEKKKVLKTIEQIFQEVDQKFNNWNPHSEISQFNRSPAHRLFSLSPELDSLLSLCAKIVSLSGGRFDPALEPLSSLWRHSLQHKKYPSSSALQTACDASGWNHLSFQEHKVQKDHPLTQIALSAISKGLCVDWIVERLQKLGYSNLFVEWGGAVRTSGKHPTGSDWVIPIDPALQIKGRTLAPIPLQNRALAISGDSKQKGWVLSAESSPDGQLHRYFPLIDASTAQPLEKTPYSIAAAIVIAPTCALADALAIAAMLFPERKEAEKWAQEVVALYPEVSFWILSYNDKR